MGLYLGVDVGTSSLKGVLCDEEGRIIKQVRIPSYVSNPAPGLFEVDVNSSWRGGFLRLLASLPDSSLQDIEGICISSVCASFAPVDETLTPLHPAVLYGIDTRAQEQVEELNQKWGSTLTQVIGTEFSTHSVLPKILWFKRNRPEIFRNTRYFVSSNNLITAWLTGIVAWDYPTAAGAHLIDCTQHTYPQELFQELGIDLSKLPPLRSPFSTLGKITNTASVETGLKEGTPVVVGACDINGECLAAGTVSPGHFTVVYGSTLSILYVVDRFIKVPGFVTGPSLFEGTYRIGGATSSGGRFLEWVESILCFSYPTRQDLKDYLSKASNFLPTGIVMLPYASGVRAPFHNPKARILWYGMENTTKPEILSLAARESLGYELAIIFETIEAHVPIPVEIHAMGGLTADPLLLQIVSDITGRKLKIHDGINAAYGDALMAMLASEDIKTILSKPAVRELQEARKVVIPQTEKHEQYHYPLKVYKRLNKAVLELY